MKSLLKMLAIVGVFACGVGVAACSSDDDGKSNTSSSSGGNNNDAKPTAAQFAERCTSCGQDKAQCEGMSKDVSDECISCVVKAATCDDALKCDACAPAGE